MKNENLSLAQLKKQRKELLALQSKLENKLKTARSVYEDLVDTNKELTNSVAFLQERNVLLNRRIEQGHVCSIR